MDIIKIQLLRDVLIVMMDLYHQIRELQHVQINLLLLIKLVLHHVKMVLF